MFDGGWRWSFGTLGLFAKPFSYQRNGPPERFGFFYVWAERLSGGVRQLTQFEISHRWSFQ
ncbi:MAG: hypothetical protein HRU70_12955 [Phycisphaeraceae bacterium]|nr:MAG: hypothetical protein HRU70_12955 [Phycisphaeraceae bacterium]